MMSSKCMTVNRWRYVRRVDPYVDFRQWERKRGSRKCSVTLCGGKAEFAFEALGRIGQIFVLCEKCVCEMNPSLLNQIIKKGDLREE